MERSAGDGTGTVAGRAVGAAGARVPRLRLLGPLAIDRPTAGPALPASRKVRALLGYLALANRPLGRAQLGELLWDATLDPRGELRWCLSKLRRVLDDPGRRRVLADAAGVRLDLADVPVDALAVERSMHALATLPEPELRALEAGFGGDFLEGLGGDFGPAFDGWLLAQRRHFRDCHVAVLARLADRLSDGEALGVLDRWQALAPLDRQVHERLLGLFARQGRIVEGDAHLAATARAFAAQGLAADGLREAWRRARATAIADGIEAVAERGEAPGGEPGVEPGGEPGVEPGGERGGEPGAADGGARRASIAVMPFVDRSIGARPSGGPGDGLARDVITRLAKLRSLFVIAQGSVFALRDRQVPAAQAGRMLAVDYVVSGTWCREGSRVIVTVELAESRTARIAWADTFEHAIDDLLEVNDAIGNRVVATIAHEIEAAEIHRAILRPPALLDAWEAYHRGLWHMYRFSRDENARAREFFQAAVRLDPTFARAHAGLSFTHFQSAFQGWAPPGPDIARAYEAAGQGLMADERDPAAHGAMGRAQWLRGRQDEAIAELECAIDLSPNFALGHYTLAFIHSQAGDAQVAVARADHSRRLSPFDPMLFGMLGARAMALARLGRFDEAADWGVKAASRANAHVHILAIAAYCLALAGRLADARAQLAEIHRRLPGYRVDDFLTAMRFAPDAQARFREAAARLTAP